METEEQNILNELDAQFGDTGIQEIPERTSEQLPKMKVIFRIENTFINRSSQSGRKQLVADCSILETDAGDEFLGKKYKKQWGLETAENWSWLKKDMKCLELDPPQKVKDLVRLTNELTGLCFHAQLAPNQDEAFPPNCYINKGARAHEYEGAASQQSTSSL